MIDVERMLYCPTRSLWSFSRRHPQVVEVSAASRMANARKIHVMSSTLQ